MAVQGTGHIRAIKQPGWPVRVARTIETCRERTAVLDQRACRARRRVDTRVLRSRPSNQPAGTYARSVRSV